MLSGRNIIDLAVGDLTVAAAILRKPRSGVEGLDVRYLAGGSACQALGEGPFDVYCGAIDAGLGRMAGLTSKGYVIQRRTVKR